MDTFSGADKQRLNDLVIKLKKDLGDETTSGLDNIRTAPVVPRVKPDLGFVQFKPLSSQPILFENLSDKTRQVFITKIVPKVKEIIEFVYESEEHKEQIQDLYKLFHEGFKADKIREAETQQMLHMITICNEKDIFVLYDFLRSILTITQIAKYVASEGWDEFLNGIERLEALSIGDPELIPKEISHAQYTASAVLCNIFKQKGPSKAIFEDANKVNKILIFAGKLLNSPKDKSVSTAASIALNAMIVFDHIEMKPLQDDSKMEMEDKKAELAERFTKYDEGIRSYCEAATKAYAVRDEEEVLFRLLMSECRLLHANYSLIEQFADDEEFLKNRIRVTQKYPSGKVNDSVIDLQKILSSYVKKD